MTHRADFVRIAHALAITKPLNSPNGCWHATCQNVADALAYGNPRFNRATFLAACGDVRHGKDGVK